MVTGNPSFLSSAKTFGHVPLLFYLVPTFSALLVKGEPIHKLFYISINFFRLIFRIFIFEKFP